MKNIKNSDNHNKESFSSKKDDASSSTLSTDSGLRPRHFQKRTCVKPQRSIKGMKSVRPRSKSSIKEE